MAQQDFRFKKARHKPSVLLQYVPKPASIQLSVAFDKKISNKFTLDPGASLTKTFPLPIPANVTYQQKFSDSSGIYPEIIFSCGLKEARTGKSIQPDRSDCAKP